MAQQQLFMDLAAHPQVILDSMDGMRLTIETIEKQQKRNRIILNVIRAVLFLCGIALIFLLKSMVLGVALFGLGVITLIYRPKRVPAKPRFEAAYQVIHALRDDVGRKGRLVGHLDLSPPNQKTKLLRTGKTSSGNTKYYYRDPWFVAKLRLVDGNVIKLLLEDRIKEKKGTFTYHHTNWENKVLVVSHIYQAAERYNPANPPILIGSGQLDPKNLKVESMLGDLKAIYAQARPIVSPASGPPPTFDAAPTETPPPAAPSIPETPPQGA